MYASGRQIRFIFKETQCSPALAIGGFNKLVNSDRVDMLVVAGRAVATPVAPLAKRLKLPLLVTAVLSDNVLKLGGYLSVILFRPVRRLH